MASRKTDQGIADEPPYVLIVDDEQLIADTLCMIIKSRGYPAVAAYSGEEALARAKEQPPKMLISDVIMQGMTGFELAMRLKDGWPDLKVLLISGQAATERLLDQVTRAGYHFDLLAKPTHPTEIISRVASAFAHYASPRKAREN